jgi:gluconokinase
LISGGIQNSRVSMQRLADVLGHPVYPNPEPEASIRGAAVFVLEKLEMPIPQLKLGTPIRPRAKLAKRYSHERHRQIALEDLLTRNPL